MDRTEYRHLRQRAYEAHRVQVHQEDMLVGSRVSWLVTSQALLLGTYVFLVNSPFVHLLPRPFSPEDGDGSGPNFGMFPYSDFDLEQLNMVVRHLRIVFQAAGFLIALAVTVSIRAAHAAIGDLLESYAAAIAEIDSLALRSDHVSAEDIELTRNMLPSLMSRPNCRLWGALPAHLMGPLFVTAWGVLYLSERTYEAWSGATVVLLVVLVAWMSLRHSRRCRYPLR